MRPLFSTKPGNTGDYIPDGAFAIWQPHFETLLMDRMAEEIFSEVGKVTTLVDFRLSGSRNGR